MDFAFTTAQDDAAELAAQIFSDKATPERLKAVEADGDRFDAELWAELGRSGLLGLHLPEEHDGAGLGLVELCRVIVEAGRTVAPVPLAAHGAASRIIAELGTPAQSSAWLPAAASGGSLLVPALAEDLEFLPARPTTTATATDDGWIVTGTKTVVASGTRAAAFLVSASVGEATRLFLVRPDDPGVALAAQRLSDGDTAARVELDGVRLGADRVIGGDTAVTRLNELWTLTVCAQQLGVTEGAIRLTAAYAKEREQFGRPIGTFQAVRQRLADGYIDTLGQALTLWQAAWRLEENHPAARELAIAKLWAADGGHIVAHTTVHIHGGVGIDMDGEAHRYFTAAKRWEFTTGPAPEQARTLGRLMAGADDPV